MEAKSHCKVHYGDGGDEEDANFQAPLSRRRSVPLIRSLWPSVMRVATNGTEEKKRAIFNKEERRTISVEDSGWDSPDQDDMIPFFDGLGLLNGVCVTFRCCLAKKGRNTVEYNSGASRYIIQRTRA